MGALISLVAVAVLTGLAWLAVTVGDLRYLIGVVLPGVAFAVFIIGIVVRVVRWARSPGSELGEIWAYRYVPIFVGLYILHLHCCWRWFCCRWRLPFKRRKNRLSGSALMLISTSTRTAHLTL